MAFFIALIYGENCRCIENYQSKELNVKNEYGKDRNSMKIISLLNLKGGVAKSFSVVNMAYELWRRGFKVLLLDNDKQGNLSKAFGKYNAEQIAPVTKLLNGDWISPEELIQSTDYEGIDIITSNMSLFGASWKMMAGEQRNTTKRYKSFIEAETEEQLEEQGITISNRYDYCIIDNPPDIGINVVNALVITDEVIVPVKIDENALEGLDIVAEQIEDARALNPSLILKGILITVYQNTDGESAGLEWLRKEWDNADSMNYRKYDILGIIRYSRKVAENSFVKKPIYEYSPCCSAAQDYKKFVTSYTGVER